MIDPRVGVRAAIGTVLALLAATLIAAPAAAVDAASISGRVLGADGNPLQYSQVMVQSGSTGWGASTDEFGDYTIAGLAPGNYTLRFSAPWGSSMLSEWWEDSLTQDGATIIPLAQGDALAGYDAQLSTGASVSGVITSAATGLPIPNLSITFYSTIDPTNYQLNQFGYTNSSGAFSIPAIVPGEYKVLFGSLSQDSGFARAWWGSGTTFENAAVVSFDSRDVVPMNMALSPTNVPVPAAAPTATVESTGVDELRLSWTKPLSADPILGYTITEDRGWSGDGYTVLGADTLSTTIPFTAGTSMSTVYTVSAVTAATIGFPAGLIHNRTGAGQMIAAPLIALSGSTENSLTFTVSPTAQPAGMTLSEWSIELIGDPGKPHREMIAGTASGASVTFSDLVEGREYTVFALGRPIQTNPRTNFTVWGSLAGVSPSVGAVTRLAGVNRFATSAQISAATFEPGVDVAYIASGLNFPDALSGAAAASVEGAPVLLTLPDGIPAEVKAELSRLQPGRIVILGGTPSVSGDVASALDAFTTGPVQRLAGANRFATSARISAAVFSPGVDVAYIASGLNFPDALSGAAAAGVTGGPVLLVKPDSIPAEVRAELARLNPDQIVILGGTPSVSAAVASSLDSFTAGGVVRLAGANRFATSAKISNATFAPGVDVAYISSGLNFPDALSGAAAAGVTGGPVLLVLPDSIPTEVRGELARLNPKNIVILGGTPSVSAGVAAQLQDYLD